MSEQTLAITQLARTVGQSLLNFATAYETAAGGAENAAALDDVELPAGRGERQRQILELVGLETETGMKTADVAAVIDYEVPNTYSTLQALERNGLVELVPGVNPQTWRLALKYRNNAPVFKRMASRVREGEWTTYGDISIAIRGDTKAARGVGSAASKMPDFPHPERVLMDGGVINPHWSDDQERGPEYCRELLIGQGVKFDEDGRAYKAQKVDWSELRRRDEEEPVVE